MAVDQRSRPHHPAQKAFVMKTPLVREASVLLIDNEPATLTGLTTLVRYAGHTCHVAPDAEATHLALAHQTLDVIICNVVFEGNSNPPLYRKVVEYSNQHAVLLIVLLDGQPPESLRRSATEHALILPRHIAPAILLNIVSNRQTASAGRSGAGTQRVRQRAAKLDGGDGRHLSLSSATGTSPFRPLSPPASGSTAIDDFAPRQRPRRRGAILRNLGGSAH